MRNHAVQIQEATFLVTLPPLYLESDCHPGVSDFGVKLLQLWGTYRRENFDPYKDVALAKAQEKRKGDVARRGKHQEQYVYKKHIRTWESKSRLA